MSARAIWMISAAIAGLLAPHSGARAQAAGAGQAVGLEEIVVTARKRTEGLQDVPVAVTALDAARLEARGFKNIQDISFSIPNVALDTIGSNSTSANFAIRGLGATSSVQSLEPSVGTFVDGAYLAVNAGVVTDTFDIERIEVLRGPQGTLFGRNVTGGAVLIETKRPSQTMGGSILARGSTGLSAPADGDYVLGAAWTGPLSDAIAVRLAGYYHQDDGYGRNLAVRVQPSINNGDDTSPDNKTWFIRPSILFEPNSEVSLLTRYEHLENDGTGMPLQNWANFREGTFDFSTNEVGISKTKVDNVNVEFNLKGGPGALTNLFNYRNLRDVFALDADGTINTLFHASGYTGSKQYSDELRYAGTVGKLDFTVGAYAYKAELKAVEGRLIGATVQSGGGTQKTTSYAVFTENQFHVTDQLSAIFGLRYTHEKKTAAITQISAAAKCGAIYPAGNTPCVVDARGGKTWNMFGFKVGGQYEFNDDTQAYASFTRSFRSGGFNLRQALPISPIPFDEEGLDAFEVGLKSTYLDGRARTNIAVFQNSATDLQRAVAVPITVSPFVLQTTANAGNARFTGFEVEQTFKPTSDFLLSAHVGYTHSKYTSIRYDLNADGLVNQKDLALKPPRAPKWSYGAQASYDLPIGGRSLTTFVSFDHRAANFFSDDNRGRVPAVDMLDARLSYKVSSQVVVAAFANNLLNDVVYGVVAPTGAFIDRSGNYPVLVTPRFGATPMSSQSSIVQRPRNIGVELRVTF